MLHAVGCCLLPAACCLLPVVLSALCVRLSARCSLLAAEHGACCMLCICVCGYDAADAKAELKELETLESSNIELTGAASARA